jgi:hypothetical protein
MSRTFKLVCEFVPRNGWEWKILGLPYTCWYKKTTTPDTALPLVGLNHGCDSPGSIVASVYEAIYDHYQVTENSFKDGDIIESEPVTVNKYLSYDDNRGKVEVPAMRMRVVSFHVVLESPDLGQYEDVED